MLGDPCQGAPSQIGGRFVHLAVIDKCGDRRPQSRHPVGLGGVAGKLALATGKVVVLKEAEDIIQLV
jgi:hypothetical protein